MLIIKHRYSDAFINKTGTIININIEIRHRYSHDCKLYCIYLYSYNQGKCSFNQTQVQTKVQIVLFLRQIQMDVSYIIAFIAWTCTVIDVNQVHVEVQSSLCKSQLLWFFEAILSLLILVYTSYSSSRHIFSIIRNVFCCINKSFIIENLVYLSVTSSQNYLYLFLFLMNDYGYQYT